MRDLSRCVPRVHTPRDRIYCCAFDLPSAGCISVCVSVTRARSAEEDEFVLGLAN